MSLFISGAHFHTIVFRVSPDTLSRELFSMSEIKG